jgi:hypothetical protein
VVNSFSFHRKCTSKFVKDTLLRVSEDPKRFELPGWVF